MKQDICKKIVVSGVLLIFLGLIIIPAVSAGVFGKPSTSNVQIPLKIDSEDYVYELVIITPKKFVKELKPLVCHKNHVDVSARLVTLNEIYE